MMVASRRLPRGGARGAGAVVDRQSTGPGRAHQRGRGRRAGRDLLGRAAPAIAPGWHTYWINPGDSGEPPRIEWALPAGFAAGDIAWPHPERIPVGPAMSFGYSREVVLPIPDHRARRLAPGARVTLRGRASWLVCEKICIPEEARRRADPAGGRREARGRDPRGAPLIAAARRAVPAPSPWPASFSATPETVDAHRGRARARRRAHRRRVVLSRALGRHRARRAAAVASAPRGITLGWRAGRCPRRRPTPIDGVLVIDERLDGGTCASAFALRAAAGAHARRPASLSLLQAVVLALAGGLMLNLMPCVLPVLSVKALGLVSHARRRARRCGVTASPTPPACSPRSAALAGALLALRAGGEQIGWGFQLQSPLVRDARSPTSSSRWR